MENIEKELAAENREKKNVAHSAANRVRGSKSTKCSLPSDYLTPAQKKALSGPVMRVNLRRPMDYASFVALPDDLKKEYLIRLHECFRATDRLISEMLGVDRHTVIKWRNLLGIKWPRGAGSRTPDGLKAAWNRFLRNEETAPEKTETAAEEQKPAEEDKPSSAIAFPREPDVSVIESALMIRAKTWKDAVAWLALQDHISGTITVKVVITG